MVAYLQVRGWQHCHPDDLRRLPTSEGGPGWGWILPPTYKTRSKMTLEEAVLQQTKFDLRALLITLKYQLKTQEAIDLGHALIDLIAPALTLFRKDKKMEEEPRTPEDMRREAKLQHQRFEVKQTLHVKGRGLVVVARFGDLQSKVKMGDYLRAPETFHCWVISGVEMMNPPRPNGEIGLIVRHTDNLDLAPGHEIEVLTPWGYNNMCADLQLRGACREK